MGIVLNLINAKTFNVIYYELPNDYIIKLSDKVRQIEKERNKPKIGYAYETLLYKNMNIMFYYGVFCSKMKPLLNQFYANNDGIIIFIDLNEERDFSLLLIAINELFQNEYVKERKNVFLVQLCN